MRRERRQTDRRSNECAVSVILHISTKLSTFKNPHTFTALFLCVTLSQKSYSFGVDMEQLEQVYRVMDSSLEQYRLDKSDLYFGRAQGAAKLALELSIITADQYVVYIESLIWERNNA